MKTQHERLLSSFPGKLKKARLQRAWSQADLAQLLDTESKTISRWEVGQVSPSPYFRQKLCTVFDLSLQDLGLFEIPDIAFSLLDPAIPLSPEYPLVGRELLLADLRQRLCKGGSCALCGLPGIGKTALSVTLANDEAVRAHFKDGILWAGLGPTPNLFGHILRWGAMLDVPITETGDIETGLFALHQVMNSRSILLIIDDVWRPEDALALKVGGPQCAYMVTTRFSWVATQMTADGAMMVEELTNEGGITLLHLLAPQTVEQEPQRIHELVKAVGGLPLALTLIGNYLRIQSYNNNRRRISQAIQLLCDDMATRLDLQESRRPAERHATQPGATLISLRSIISVSVERLDDPVCRALYALAIFPPKPNGFSEEAALVVANCNVEMLDTLVDTGLLQINNANRYMLHPTVADYACRELEESGGFEQANLRLIAYFTNFVEMHRTNTPLLEEEHLNILAALEAAFVQDGATELPRLACAFTLHLLSCGLASHAEHHLRRAYETARISEDRNNLVMVLLALEQVFQHQGKDVSDILESVSSELSL